MNATVTRPSPAELEELFFEPPREPELPAKRWPYHNGRRWKLETQGRADRRARRGYRAAMTEWQNEMREAQEYMAEFDKRWAALIPTLSPGSSLYDFIMGTKK